MSAAHAPVNASPPVTRSYLYSYPENEAAFISSLFSDPTATLAFEELLSALMGARRAATPDS